MLFALLLCVVAGLQESLDVVFIPEETLASSVWDLMVGNQLRRVALKHAASALALKAITNEDPDA